MISRDVGVLPYAGICGLIPLFDKIRYTGDMNHPLIHNVIDGDWLIEYSVDRLDTDKDDAFSGAVVIVLLKVASWLREVRSTFHYSIDFNFYTYNNHSSLSTPYSLSIDIYYVHHCTYNFRPSLNLCVTSLVNCCRHTSTGSSLLSTVGSPNELCREFQNLLDHVQIHS